MVPLCSPITSRMRSTSCHSLLKRLIWTNKHLFLQMSQRPLKEIILEPHRLHRIWLAVGQLIINRWFLSQCIHLLKRYIMSHSTLSILRAGCTMDWYQKTKAVRKMLILRLIRTFEHQMIEENQISSAFNFQLLFWIWKFQNKKLD